MTRNRIQKGSLSLRSGNWYVRYWTGPKSDRKMAAHKLGKKDDVLYGRSSGQLRKLAEEHMAKVNAEAEAFVEEDQTVVEFYERTYLPWVEANKKPSTVHSYKQIWSQHLEKHFGQRTLVPIWLGVVEAGNGIEARSIGTAAVDNGIGHADYRRGVPATAEFGEDWFVGTEFALYGLRKNSTEVFFVLCVGAITDFLIGVEIPILPYGAAFRSKKRERGRWYGMNTDAWC